MPVHEKKILTMEIAFGLPGIGLAVLGKMLENQTKILERIEGKLPRTYAGQD